MNHLPSGDRSGWDRPLGIYPSYRVHWLGIVLGCYSLFFVSSFTSVRLAEFALLMIFISIIIGIDDIRRRWNDCQIIYKNGFIDIRRGKAYVIPYNDVKNIFKAQCYYSFELKNGKRIKSRTQAVGNTVQAAIFQAKRPQISQAYRQGERIPFGPIAISTEGLIHNRKILPWSAIGSFHINRIRKGDVIQKLHIRQCNDRSWFQFLLHPYWAVIPIRTIANLDLFLELAQKLQHSIGDFPWHPYWDIQEDSSGY